ncbi:hypothetical protein WA026_019223 [Henosepilachna vigintioctopunctata]|uniref:WW domain-containing protein n=1 Tax=Henosepilachna vigintioctopunctata TaxID=420089 RepID=A0AAW1V0L0_9CUCU
MLSVWKVSGYCQSRQLPNDTTPSIDRFTKPQTFADCRGNELPLGWEEAYDKQIGPYYINHMTQSTQLEDPRLEWRTIQEAMLREYLQTAQDVLELFGIYVNLVNRLDKSLEDPLMPYQFISEYFGVNAIVFMVFKA